MYEVFVHKGLREIVGRPRLYSPDECDTMSGVAVARGRERKGQDDHSCVSMMTDAFAIRDVSGRA